MTTFLLFPLILGFTSWPIWSKPLENPYFFEAQKGKHTLYLFGTNHVGIHIDEIPDYVRTTLQKQQVYLTETLKDSPQDDEESSFGDSTETSMTPDVIKQLEARGLNAKWIELVKRFPGLACTVYESYEGIRDHLLLDEELEKLAGESKKIKIALDDPKRMAKLNKKKHEACNLKKKISEEPGEEARKNYELSLVEYRRGDMKDAVVSEKDDQNEVAQRNAEWLKTILTQHPKSTFSAVGYGHLGGKKGLLQLLRDKGFKIYRINAKGRTELNSVEQ